MLLVSESLKYKNNMMLQLIKEEYNKFVQESDKVMLINYDNYNQTEKANLELYRQ